MDKTYSVREIKLALELKEILESPLLAAGELPTVDMDKVHEDRDLLERLDMIEAMLKTIIAESRMREEGASGEPQKIRKHFTMTKEFIDGMDDSSPSKKFLQEYRKKCMALESAEFEEKLVDNQRAMERLQELVKAGKSVVVHRNSVDVVSVLVDDEDEIKIEYTKKWRSGLGATISEAILNIKIEGGESNGARTTDGA